MNTQSDPTEQYSTVGYILDNIIDNNNIMITYRQHKKIYIMHSKMNIIIASIIR